MVLAGQGCPMPSRPAFQGAKTSVSQTQVSLISRHGCGHTGSHLTRSRGPTGRLKRWGSQDRGSRRRAGQRSDLNKCTPQVPMRCIGTAWAIGSRCSSAREAMRSFMIGPGATALIRMPWAA